LVLNIPALPPLSLHHINLATSCLFLGSFESPLALQPFEPPLVEELPLLCPYLPAGQKGWSKCSSRGTAWGSENLS